MKPQEALQLLDSLTGEMALKRADHVRVQQAIAVLQEVIAPKENKKK